MNNSNVFQCGVLNQGNKITMILKCEPMAVLKNEIGFEQFEGEHEQA